MLLVASPFSKTKEAVVNSASDLIFIGQQELEKIENDPNLTDTQKTAFKNTLADLAQMLQELGERKGLWPKFIYVNMKNPNALMKKAHAFREGVKMTSQALQVQVGIERLSKSLSEPGTPADGPDSSTHVLADDPAYQEPTPTQSTFGDIRVPGRPMHMHISMEDISLPQMMERLGDTEGRARANELAGRTDMSTLRRDMDSTPYEYSVQRQAPVWALSPGGRAITDPAELTPQRSQSIPGPSQSLDAPDVEAELDGETFNKPVTDDHPGRPLNVISFLNSSQASFGGRTYPDGTVVEAGAVFSVNQAVWEERARGGRDPDPWAIAQR